MAYFEIATFYSLLFGGLDDYLKSSLALSWEWVDCRIASDLTPKL